MVLTLTVPSFLASLNWHLAVVSVTGTPAHITFECSSVSVNIIIEISQTVLPCHFALAHQEA